MNTFRTLSAVDLDNLEPLETAFQKLSTELTQLDPDSAQRARRLLNESRRSTPSPTYLEGLDAMADCIYSGNTSQLSDWLEEVRPSAPISVLALCHDLINETEFAAAHPELTNAAKAVIQAHDQAAFAQRNPDCDSLSVMLPLQLDTQAPPPNSAFEQRTNWHSAVENLVPVGTPAELSKTWLEIELEGKK